MADLVGVIYEAKSLHMGIATPMEWSNDSCRLDNFALFCN